MVIYVLLGIVLITLLSFAVTATGLGLLLSFPIGAMAWYFFRLVDPNDRGPRAFWRVSGVTAGGAVLGVGGAVGLGLSHQPVFDATGIIVAVVTAAALHAVWSKRDDVRCTLCKRSVQSGASFTCPRCNDCICARPECWSARYARCSRCLEREIVIFPIADKWWDRRLGGRVTKGECVSCLRDAGEADLRECGQCHWPTCRRCWDYNNGACQRCGWVMPDTPQALVGSMRGPRAARPERRPTRSSR